MTYIYSKNGSQKVNIDDATMLGDVAADLHIYQQGDNTQLWRSKNGSYFRGSCLHHAQGHGGVAKYQKFVPMTKAEAKAWVVDYYGPSELERFGFADNADEI